MFFLKYKTENPTFGTGKTDHIARNWFTTTVGIPSCLNELLPTVWLRSAWLQVLSWICGGLTGCLFARHYNPLDVYFSREITSKVAFKNRIKIEMKTSIFLQSYSAARLGSFSLYHSVVNVLICGQVSLKSSFSFFFQNFSLRFLSYFELSA